MSDYVLPVFQSSGQKFTTVKSHEDAINDSLDEINAALVAETSARIAGDDANTEGSYYAGVWDASSGVFPSVRGAGGSVESGDYFDVSVAGTVDGVDFEVGERIKALVDNPSITTLAGSWYHAETIAILGPINAELDTFSIPFDEVSDLFADTTTISQYRARYGNTGTAYAVVKNGGYRYSLDLGQSGSGLGYIQSDGLVNFFVLANSNRAYVPEMVGAIGDGSDEHLPCQQIIDIAESKKNAKVIFAPENTYGLTQTLIFGAGAYHVEFYGVSGNNSNVPTTFTFTKLANVMAYTVPTGTQTMPLIQNISVKGRGASLPQNTDPLLDSTPGALIQSKATLVNPLFHKTGGLVGGIGEHDTTGYALGIFHADGGNVNYASAMGVIVDRCTGDGVYVDRVEGSNLNTNAIEVDVRQYIFSSGYAINGYGFRNKYFVRHYSQVSVASLGVFSIRYVESVAHSQYAEGGTPLLVDFGSTGARNRITCQDADSYTSITPDLRSNFVFDTQSGTEYMGNAGGGSQRYFTGSTGVQFDAIKLPDAVTGGVFSKVDAANTGDYGGAIDLLYGSTSGGATFSAKEFDIARIGRIVVASVRIEGTLVTSSSSACTLIIDRSLTGIDLTNMSNLGVVGPLSVVNDVETKLVYLRFNSVDTWRFVDSAGAALTFNNVVGGTNFTIAGAITFMAREGQG